MLRSPLKKLSRQVAGMQRRTPSLAGALVHLAHGCHRTGRTGAWAVEAGLPRAAEVLTAMTPHLKVLFDPKWYTARYPVVGKSTLTPWRFFLRHGGLMGHDPSPVFRTGWYLEQHPQLVGAGINPFIHYLAGAYRQGASPCPLFDVAWYLDQNADVRAAGIEPLSHYLAHGEAEGRRPHPLFDPDYYHRRYPDVREHGMSALWHYLAYGATEGRDPSADFNAAEYMNERPDARSSPLTPLEHYAVARAETVRPEEQSCVHPETSPLWLDEFPQLRALRFFAVPRVAPRLTVVLDRLDSTGLFGGVATAVIFATLLAKSRGLRLRIITRHARAEPAQFKRVLKAHGLACDEEIEFDFCARTEPEARADIGTDELVLTTSWWSTWSCLQTVHPRRIVYLLQEDERAFYCSGDTQLRCHEVMANSDITFVVNTRGLMDYLVAEGFANIAAHGNAFEPCFPRELFYWQDNNKKPRARRQFMFYCRPKHPRNLFFRGVESINAAIVRHVLDPAEWDFHFCGADVPALELAHGVRPRIHDNVSWTKYAALVRSTDLGLALMYTPHPSYPPLDLAASGAAVVTSSFGNKQALSHLSKNIICVPPALDALADGLQRGVDLANNVGRRRRHYEADQISRDWALAMASAVRHVTERH